MKLPFQKSHGLLAVITLIAAGLYALLVLRPGYATIDQLATNLAVVRGELSHLGDESVRAEQLQQELQAVEDYNRQWHSRLHSGSAISEVYAQITDLAQSTGVSTTRLDPSADVNYSTICKTPLSLELTGTYQEVHDFLVALENREEVIWIDELRLRKDRQSEGYLQCELTMGIFADQPEISN